jgi:hypothetical protein
MTGVSVEQDFKRTDGGVDSKTWNWFPTTSQFFGRILDDARSIGRNWMAVTRSGMSITSIVFSGAAFVVAPDPGGPGLFRVGGGIQISALSKLRWGEDAGGTWPYMARDGATGGAIWGTRTTSVDTDRLFLTTAALNPATVGGLTLGTQALPWGTGYANAFFIGSGGAIPGATTQITVTGYNASNANVGYMAGGRIDHTWYDSVASLDEKRWDLSVDGVGGPRTFIFLTRTDAGVAGMQWLRVQRSLQTVTDITLLASGIVTINAALSVLSGVSISGVLSAGSKVLIDGNDATLVGSQMGLAENVGNLWVAARGGVVALMDSDASGAGSFSISKGTMSAPTPLWTVNIAGGLLAGTDNLYDIGSGTGLRPRTGYFGASVVVNTDPGGNAALRVGGGGLFSSAVSVSGTSANVRIAGSTAELVLDPRAGAGPPWELYVPSTASFRLYHSADQFIFNDTEISPASASGKTLGTVSLPFGAANITTNLVVGPNAGGGTITATSTGSGETHITMGGSGSIDGSGGEFQVKGAGTVPLTFYTNSVSRWQMDSLGHLLASTDNTYDIGSGTVSRPRTGYFGASVVVGTDPGGNAGFRSSLGIRLANAQGFTWLDNAGATTNQGYLQYTTGNNMDIGTSNLARWRVAAAGHLVTRNGDNTYDIGSGSARPRDLLLGGDIYLGTIGKFEGTPTGGLRTDDVWSYNGTHWTNRLLQVSFASGDVASALQGDGTRAVYVNTVTSPAGTPTAPTSEQDLVLTPIYKGMIVDASAYGALPANMQFVVEYSINSGSSFTGMPAFTGSKIVHSKLNLPWGYRYRYKVRGASDSAYSDQTADTLPSSTAETNAYGIIVASQIATDSLSAITANLGEITTGRIRNEANNAGILITSGTVPVEWLRYLNLGGADVSFLKHPKLDLKNDGNATFFGALDITVPSVVFSGVHHISLRDPNVAHGVTSLAPTDVLGILGPVDGTQFGGLGLTGITDSDGYPGISIVGVSTTLGTVFPAIVMRGLKKSGSSTTRLTATEKIFQIDGGSGETTYVRGDGTVYHTFGQGNTGAYISNFHTNVSGTSTTSTSETELISYTLVSGAMGQDNRMLRIVTWGINIAGAASKIIRLKIGGVLIADIATTSNINDSWRIVADIIRTGPTTARGSAHCTFGSSTVITDAESKLVTISAAVNWLTASQNIIVTGETGTSAQRVTHKGWYITYLPSPI